MTDPAKTVNKYKEVKWVGFKAFYITQYTLKEMFGLNRPVTLNLFFLTRFERLPWLGLSAYSPTEIYRKRLPLFGHLPYIKTIKYTKQDPEWNKKCMNENECVQYIFTLVKSSIQLSYSKNGDMSPVYEFDLPPIKGDAHLVFFIMKPMNQYVRIFTESQLLKFLLNEPMEEKEEPTEKDEQDWECKLCFDNVVNQVLVPCGHCFCLRCFEIMEKTNLRPNECPICNQHFQNKCSIYKTTNYCLLCNNLPGVCTTLNVALMPCGCVTCCKESIMLENLIMMRCPSCNQPVDNFQHVYI